MPVGGPALDLSSPNALLAQDPEAILVARDLNRYPSINGGVSPFTFTYEAWQPSSWRATRSATAIVPMEWANRV